MEQETDFFHLFTRHQIAIFVVGSLLIMACFAGVGILIGRRAREERCRVAQINPQNNQIFDTRYEICGFVVIGGGL